MRDRIAERATLGGAMRPQNTRLMNMIVYMARQSVYLRIPRLGTEYWDLSHPGQVSRSGRADSPNQPIITLLGLQTVWPAPAVCNTEADPRKQPRYMVYETFRQLRLIEGEESGLVDLRVPSGPAHVICFWSWAKRVRP